MIFERGKDMTAKEFNRFEKMTYDILDKLKPTLEGYIQTWGPLDLKGVKYTATELVYKGYIQDFELPPEFNDDLFNFITDDEFVRWLERSEIAMCVEYHGFTVNKLIDV